VMEGFGQRFGFPVGAGERGRLGASVPSWLAFPDTVGALRALGRRYRLDIISNIDDDLFAASALQLGVPFDAVVTAEQAWCYKRHRPIFEEALRRLGVVPGSVAHIAEGVAEIAPMRRLGCSTVCGSAGTGDPHACSPSPWISKCRTYTPRCRGCWAQAPEPAAARRHLSAAILWV
jgi:2-haloacid dehalogenase